MSPGSLKLITATRMDNAHNWFLNIGANYGLVSIFFLLVILAVVLFYSASHLKHQSKSGVVGVSASVAFYCMFIDGMVSLEQPGIGIWLYLFAGVAVASSREQLRHTGEIGLTNEPYSKIWLASSRYIVSGIAILLLISCAALSQRVYFDAILRSNVQSMVLNKGTAQTVSNIESAAISLRSEPEYSVQAIQPLAALGEAAKLDSISKAVYDFYPNSIQASLIRADVLKALNRNNESCEMRSLLLLNTPWDFSQLERYIDCSLDGFQYPSIIQTLKTVDQFSSKLDRSVIARDANEVKNVTLRLNLAAVQARTYFILGQMPLARDLQRFGNSLLTRLIELKIYNPTSVTESQVKNFRRLLNF
jgi:hypothetical protein